MSAVLAFTKRNAREAADNVFRPLNPINHERTPEEVVRYKVAPYVIAADVYSVARHVGRGGWTLYTGAAGWMYRAGSEAILGVGREGGFLIVEPCIPDAWPELDVSLDVASTRYEIQVKYVSKGIQDGRNCVLDGDNIECSEGQIRVPLDGRNHNMQLCVSARESRS